MAFNRFESYKQAITDKSIDPNTLQVMIDFHVTKGTLTTAEGDELFLLMAPPTEPNPA
jgi:hypothetical protein